AAPCSLHSFPTRRSSDLQHFLSCPGIFELFVFFACIDSTQKPENLLLVHFLQLGFRNRPGESILFQFFGPQRKSVQVPVKNFHEDRKSTRLNSSHVKISY